MVWLLIVSLFGKLVVSFLRCVLLCGPWWPGAYNVAQFHPSPPKFWGYRHNSLCLLYCTICIIKLGPLYKLVSSFILFSSLTKIFFIIY